MTEENKITEKKMFECEKCGIRFEKMEEAVEHEKNCKADELIEEKSEEHAGKEEKIEDIKTEEDIIKKIVDGAEEEDLFQENLNTDIEKELDLANNIHEEAEEEPAKPAEEKEEIKEPEIKAEPASIIIESEPEAIKDEKIEAPQAQKEEKTKCTLCGLCRMSCPAYSVMLNEAVSPRGKAMMLKKDMPSQFLYLCTLCKACENACVLKDIDITKKIVEFRKEMVKMGIKTEANERMIDNIRKFGNAIGRIEPGKKVTFWCC